MWCRKGKAFVKVNFHCIVRNLKKDKRNIDVAPPGKLSAETHDNDLYDVIHYECLSHNDLYDAIRYECLKIAFKNLQKSL